MRIEISVDKCIGAGNCVDVAPEVFDQDLVQGKVVLLQANPSPEFEAAARKAADICPMRAIAAFDA